MPVAITTIIATMKIQSGTAILTAEALLRLHAWLSPAFPVGAFAYSHALEWVVETGDVRDEPTLCDWLTDLLRLGSGRSDAILLRHAYRATSTVALAEVAELAAAVSPSRERREETLAQGTAFAAAAMAWGALPLTALAAAGVDRVAYPVAVGALAAAHSIGEDATTACYLQAFAGNLISAAVRLIPLGQSAGLRVTAALERPILDVAGETAMAGLDDLGSSCFRSDIAAMRHETQYTRLFRT
jgi:urease accessory protein